MPSPYPAARVAIDEESWRAFRHAALVRGTSISTYLGELVRQELERRGVSGISVVERAETPANEALAALRLVRASIKELDDIAGRLARSASELGGPWEDIGSSLGLTEDDARRAYEAPRY